MTHEFKQEVIPTEQLLADHHSEQNLKERCDRKTNQRSNNVSYAWGSVTPVKYLQGKRLNVKLNVVTFHCKYLLTSLAIYILLPQ